MSIVYKDADNISHNMQAEDAGSGEKRPVHAIGGTAATDISTIKGYLLTLSGIVTAAQGAVVDAAANTKLTSILSALTTLQGYVDGLEGLATSLNGYADGLETGIAGLATLLTTLNGYVDGLEALIASTNGYVDGMETFASALNGYVDGLEGFVDGLEGFTDGIETKLDTIATNQGVPSGGPKIGTVGSIGSGADVQFGSQALTHGMSVKNTSTAGQTLWVATSATPSATNSWLLPAGESTPFIECSNATAVFLRASASGGAAAFLGA